MASFCAGRNPWHFFGAVLSCEAHNALVKLVITSGNTVMKAFYTFFGLVAFCMTTFLNWSTQGIGRNQYHLLAQLSCLNVGFLKLQVCTNMKGRYGKCNMG
ncbi:hypothetical protein DM01DRAFT_1341658 [Hesseltinella vesiculosa]|uniref:Uncharacterized protein n=1 Tax=Hesseltinella vesiculosa TaxID=101127 RepID=A0A1X2GYF2_9FUNG|nr:hypothetical protein DM01DRAFT_1341658 [Hesseltinella vesiculosa]